MKYLITGGAGFIGSHLTRLLLDKKHQVVVLDNLSTGSRENIKDLKKNKKFVFKKGDILNTKTLRPLIKEADIVVHLAAAVGAKLVSERPLESLMVNVEGTANVLKLASELGNKRVLIASSSETYGKNNVVPYSEDDDRVIGPSTINRWGYATSKMMDEFLGLAYYKQKSLPVVIMRFFNTVGPRQVGTYGMVIPKMVTQALKNEPITVYGDGSQTRCFTYVGDTTNIIYLLSGNKKATGEIVNVGGTEEIKIIDLAKRIINISKSKSKIKLVPFEKVFEKGFKDMKRRKPNIAKLKKLTDYTPKVKLDEILKTVIDDIKEK